VDSGGPTSRVDTATIKF